MYWTMERSSYWVRSLISFIGPFRVNGSCSTAVNTPISVNVFDVSCARLSYRSSMPAVSVSKLADGHIYTQSDKLACGSSTFPVKVFNGSRSRYFQDNSSLLC